MAIGKDRKNLWALTQGQRLRYFAAIAVMGLASLCLFGSPLVAKYVLDVIDGEDMAKGIAVLTDLAMAIDPEEPLLAYLIVSALSIVLVTAIGGFFLYLRGRWAAIASESIIRRLRDRLYSHLHHLPVSFHDSADTGDLVQRCSSDVETIRVFLSSDIVEIGRAIILILTVIPILFWLHADLAYISLMLLPLIFVFAYWFFARVKRVFQITDESEAAMTAVLQENLTGIRVVRAFARQAFEIGRFGERNAEFRDNNYRLVRLMGFYWATGDLIALTQVGLVIYFGSLWFMQGSVTMGTLFAFILYENMIIWPIRQLGRVLTDSGKAVVSLVRVNEILDSPEETRAEPPGQGRADGRIHIENLTFGYDPDKPVLEDISVSIAAGETLAIVGPPGCGKSTLIRLLLRLYEYEKGSIRLDGRELNTLNRKYVRSQIGVVLQDPFLYSRSIEANLRVGRKDADADAILDAARDASIHEAIVEFTEGYDAMVGERGVTLSGGQRQRLALARALLKDPPILVLDDALSAVDTGTERRILEALEQRKGRHTTLVISHRLSSVIHADRIMVLERGRIVQLGNHEELIRADGPYRRLCEIQGNLEAQIRRDLMHGAT